MSQAAVKNGKRKFPAARPQSFFLTLLLLLHFSTNTLTTLTAAAPDLSPAAPEQKVIIVFAGALSLSDLEVRGTPNLHALIERGALGIMNIRTAGSYSPENAYATFGAKERAIGSPETGFAFSATERYGNSRADQVFHCRTGANAPPESIVVLDYPRILRNNLRNNPLPTVGALGEALEAAGKKIAVIGNADTDLPGREVALAFMNQKGYVTGGGYVGKDLTVSDAGRPFGLKTDYEKVLLHLKELIEKVDCLGIETGDTSRVDKYRDLILPEQREKLKRAALRDLDGFLGRLLASLDLNRVTLLLLSPYPSREAVEKGDTLPPVLAAGAGFGSGLLYSASTRRPGIVTVYDLQATIFHTLGVPVPSGFQGRPLSSQSHPEPFAYLTAINDRIVEVNVTRTPVLKGFVVVQIILLILAMVIILLRPGKAKVYTLQRMALTGITTVPLALLFLPLTRISGVLAITLYLMAVGFIVSLLVFKISTPRLLGLVALATAAAIFLDVLRGSPLMSESLLGYSPVGGARYYGIGNEYMGILLGASLTGTSIILDRIRPWRRTVPLVLPVFTAWTYITAAPWLGSNLGGGIGLSVAYLVMLLLLAEVKMTRGRILLIAVGGAALFVITLALVDSFRNPSVQSHLGQLTAVIRKEGLSVTVPIILRKIRMNLTLIEYTIWTKALITFIVVLGVLFYHPRGKLAEIARVYPSFFKGFWSALMGSATVLVVNDSGIVASATALLYPVITMVSIILENLQRNQPSPQ